jgi:hypothetical protein
MVETLNHRQTHVLAELREREGVPSSTFDGRILRALRSRGLVELRDGRVWLTAEGRSTRGEAPDARPSRRRPSPSEGNSPRQQAILRSLEAIEAALPAEAEVAVGPIFAYADDVVKGLRRYARSLGEG